MGIILPSDLSLGLYKEGRTFDPEVVQAIDDVQPKDVAHVGSKNVISVSDRVQ